MTRAAESGVQALTNLVQKTISIIRLDAQRGDSSLDYFLGNTRLKQRYVDNGTDARGLSVVSVNFRLRPTVSAVKVTTVA